MKTALAGVKNRSTDFDIINRISERFVFYDGVKVDSAACIQLLQIGQLLNNDSLLAISYNWIGSYFTFNNGDNAAGLEYYFKAIPLAEKAHDKRRISSLYFDIALLYAQLHNNEEAVRNNRKGGENLPEKSSPKYEYMLVQYQRGHGEVLSSGQ